MRRTRADTGSHFFGEYHDRGWGFRFGEALMPKVANGIDLVWNLRQARAENYELELHPHAFGNRGTTLRLLSFVNHANMGVYRDAINNHLVGQDVRARHPGAPAADHGEVRVRHQPPAGGDPFHASLLALRIGTRANTNRTRIPRRTTSLPENWVARDSCRGMGT
jgi:hypothetical protein